MGACDWSPDVCSSDLNNKKIILRLAHVLKIGNRKVVSSKASSSCDLHYVSRDGPRSQDFLVAALLVPF